MKITQSYRTYWDPEVARMLVLFQVDGDETEYAAHFCFDRTTKQLCCLNYGIVDSADEIGVPYGTDVAALEAEARKHF
jgi:hypothetical protein